MKATLNKNEIIEEIRRVNSEQGNPACLSWQVFESKTRLAYSKTTILKSFDGKWTLACNAAEVTPCEAANPKNLISPPKYSKDQIREKLEQIARKMPDGLIVCWEDDWKDCPLEVLELKKAIQSLSGWKEN